MQVEWNFSELNKVTKGKNNFKFKDLKITGLSIDTRTLKKGDLFCTLKGDNFDGHEFISQALKKGASCLLLSDANKVVPKIPYIKVENVLEAIEKIAVNIRKKHNAKFIGVTGSVGKTGTKEMIKLALSNIGNTFANKGNYNNHIGVPLSLAETPYDSEYCILELGMNKTGEINKLSKLVAPEIGIITAIENSHLKGLKSLKNIARAKSEILNNIQKDGCFIYNSDTNFSEELEVKAKKKRIKHIISYGKNKKADIQLINIKKMQKNYLLEVNNFGKRVFWKMPDLNEHWYINSLSILGIAKYLDLKLETLLKNLKKFKLPNGRGNLIEVKSKSKKFFIINESYNSCPVSLTAALEKFKKIKVKGKKIVILGDMKELGTSSLDFHLNLKEILDKTDISIVYTVGDQMKELSNVLPSYLSKHHFENLILLEQEIKKIIQHNDFLLVKGSHAIGLLSFVKRISGKNYDI